MRREIPVRLRRAVTGVYLLFLYATLGIARPVAEYLRGRGLLRWTVIALFLLAAPPVLLWRRKTAGPRLLLVRILLIILLLTGAAVFAGLPEEQLHFLTYGLLGWLIRWSLETVDPAQRPLPATGGWVLSCLLVWLAGAGDELIQWILPMRVFDLRDIAFNGCAGMAGIAMFATGGQLEH